MYPYREKAMALCLQFKGFFTKLTPQEKAFLILNVDLVMTIDANADKALLEARKRFPDKRLHNDEGDAFRHCYWSALLARDIGFSKAKKFLDAHESPCDNPVGEKMMDLTNNEVGLRIGVSLQGQTDEVLSRACYTALISGKLVVAPFSFPYKPKTLDPFVQ
jgi:hypothetical protein